MYRRRKARQSRKSDLDFKICLKEKQFNSVALKHDLNCFFELEDSGAFSEKNIFTFKDRYAILSEYVKAPTLGQRITPTGTW